MYRRQHGPDAIASGDVLKSEADTLQTAGDSAGGGGNHQQRRARVDDPECRVERGRGSEAVPGPRWLCWLGARTVRGRVCGGRTDAHQVLLTATQIVLPGHGTALSVKSLLPESFAQSPGQPAHLDGELAGEPSLGAGLLLEVKSASRPAFPGKATESQVGGGRGCETRASHQV